ncbi:hypothetical protein PR202_ga19250 [Eleusine coracana subsp. coracana]|uniref:Uncharacterized protein n=1 Tax=Eleusine coracana subsp. coracana TaxID=191504 RepID=A0AAV5CVX5_ELECO|nr:hypothetical protein PR202_ga19250 [Eleusine coracana subsp. coracana]
MARFQEFEVRKDKRAAAADVGHEDHLMNPLNSGVANLPVEERVPKARKPYTISKQREKWTEDEHKLFLESLQLHGRAWRRIQEHIGSKTAVQIRSHAQKFFSKVTRESSGEGNGVAAALQIRIPPPRPKRKPTHPYPRKLVNSPGKDALVLRQLDKPELQLQSLYEQENVSPKSVLTGAQAGSETLASDSVRSPTSSVDVKESCHAPRIAAVEVATQLPPYKVANSDTVSNHEACGISESPVLRLFGKRVVGNDLHHQPKSKTENEQKAADMELDESAETPTSGTRRLFSHSAAEANTMSSWPTDTNQFMYYLPRGKVLFVPSDCQFFSYNNESVACSVLNPQAKQKHQHQPSQAADFRFPSREGFCSESITTSSGMPGTSTQNSDSVESMQVTNNKEDEVIPVPGSRKCVNQTSDCLRGFVPYKKCTAESERVQSKTSGEEADREMTRLCL